MKKGTYEQMMKLRNAGKLYQDEILAEVYPETKGHWFLKVGNATIESTTKEGCLKYAKQNVRKEFYDT